MKLVLVERLAVIVLLICLGVYTYVRFSNKSGAALQFSNQPPTPSVTCEFNDLVGYHSYENTDIWWKNNNKFGLYIYAEDKDYIELAQKLVNTNGGDWGYVLIPLNVKDRDRVRWNRVFDQLTAKQLIPVIQLWDVDVSDYKAQTDGAADFLNSFVWPIRYKYISAYNEPNDSDFWKGKVDPKEYAEVLAYTIEAFKRENPDFYIMNAGLNTSARTDSATMDAFSFMRAMNDAVPGIFERLDAWASHSYPQPNFSGSPYVVGRWSIRAYETELDFLHESLGVQKELPVFITETGWAHAEGENFNSSYLSIDTISDYFQKAYKDIWLKDDRVRAVFPFTIWYNPPHDHFSWINKDKVPYKHYDVIKDMKKIKGEPPKITTGTVDLRKCGGNDQVENN